MTWAGIADSLMPGANPGIDAPELTRELTTALRRLCSKHGAETAVTISRAGEDRVFDYATLWSRSAKAAAFIAARSDPGDRVLLPMPTSPEFVEAFFGCILSARIAVPLPMEKKGSRFSRAANVVADCSPRLALFRNEMDLRQMQEGLTGTHCIAIAESDWMSTDALDDVPASADAAAFIQYTSGSTSSPKGVLITHGNIMANTGMIREGMGLCPTDRVVSWLPIHHDLGLMGMLLAPIATRAAPFLFPPEEFARDPASWLTATSRRGGTLTGAPNFAFDLIVRRARRSLLDDLDLSKVRVMYCGSERIAEATVRSFFDHLRSTGLKTGSFFTCYGMAEASVYVTGGFKDVRLPLAPAGSGQPTHPSCGVVATGLELRIVDDGGALVADGDTGEVEIAGPSVSPGYWSDLATDLRGGRIGRAAGWLRTGDLAFMCGSELVVSGRLKDVVKVRGRNIHPEDLEMPLEAAAAGWLSPNGAVVVSTVDPAGGGDLLSVVVEIDRVRRKGPFDGLMSLVQGVLAEFDVRCERLVVISPMCLPKTSSGKKQRNRTARMLEDGALAVLWDSLAAPKRSDPPSIAGPEGVDMVRFGRYLAAMDFVLADERRTFPADFLKNLAACGLLSMTVPSGFGGAGLSHAQFASVGEELGRMDLSAAAVVGIHNTIGLLPVLWSEVLADRSDVLRSIVSLGEVAAFALTEEAAGSNPRAIVSSVVRRDGRLLLTGEKVWIGNATFASYVVVFVQEVDEAGAALGVSGFLLRKGVHDFGVCAEQLTLGVRAMPQARIVFDGTELSEADRLTRPGEGLALAYRAMEYARFGLAAMACGALQAALDHMWTHVSTRTISTGPLLENGHFRVAVGETLVDLAVLRAVVATTAAHLDRTGALPQALSLTCKILAGEIGFQGVDRALQFSGGRGYTETFGLARIWRDVRVLRIFEGPTEAVAAHLGGLVARRPQMILEAFPPHGQIDRPPHLSEAVRLVELVASIYGGTNMHDAFLVDLGMFAARQIGFAAFLGEPHEEDVCAAVVTERRLTANRFERRMGTLKGIEAAFVHLSRPFGRGAPALARSSRMYDDWTGEAPRTARESHPSPLNERITLPAVADHLQSVPESTLQTPRSDIVERLGEWIASATKVRVVDPDRPIVQYGIDSLLAFELHCFVEEAFDVRLPDTAFVENLSTRQLGVHIAEGAAA